MKILSADKVEVRIERQPDSSDCKWYLYCKIEKKDKSKSIADLTKSSKKIDGLFPIFQDTINGKLKMVISKDQFEKEFIYFSQIADGVVEAGRYRGAYQNEIIFF